jgi:hypothetical protein
MDLRHDRSSWPPDDFQGCAQRLVCKSGLKTCYSELGNESDGTYKEGQPGIQGVGGALSSYVVSVTPADVSDSNIW